MDTVTHRFWVRAAVVSATVAALAGCGNSNSPGATSTTSSTATTTTSGAAWSRPGNPPDPQTLMRAGALAVEKVPDSTLVFIESETDDAGTWKVQVVTPDGAEQQMKVGADAYTVLVGPTPQNDSDADKAKRHTTVQAAQLDYRAAVDKMLAAVPNGSITQLSLVDVDGTTEWKADVWDTYLVEHDVTVNAASGELIANKQI